MPATILRRLNISNRAALISLSVSDHYVEITTLKGKELVLMRFSDAISETGDNIGLQIHRSHWVALNHIKSVDRKNAKTTVTMCNGKIFPISRSYHDAAKQAGIF